MEIMADNSASSLVQVRLKLAFSMLETESVPNQSVASPCAPPEPAQNPTATSICVHLTSELSTVENDVFPVF
jgi:hypothetical protein